MKTLTKLMLSLCVAASPSIAFSQNINLRLQLKPNGESVTVTPLSAETGNFGVTQSAPATSRYDRIRIVAKNRAGKVIYTTFADNTLFRRYEAVNQKTGEFESLGTGLLSSSTVDVAMPYNADVDSIEVYREAKPVRVRADRKAALQMPVAELPVSVLDNRGIRAMLDRGKVGRNKTTAAATLVGSVLPSTYLQYNGPGSTKLDIVLIGDGYTSSEMNKWQTDANSMKTTLLADPLFAANSGRINIRRLDKISAQSGIDQPDPYLTNKIYVNTAYDGAMCPSNPTPGAESVYRLLCYSSTKLNDDLNATIPLGNERELVVLISNTTRYAGSGGNPIAAVSISSPEILLHEVGHTLFGLADEYSGSAGDPSCGVTTEPVEGNVSLSYSRTNKWGSQMAANVTLPTPINTYTLGTVGAFTGGKYCTSGVYRPTENSRMRSNGRPWDAVNTKLGTRRLWNYWMTVKQNVVSGGTSTVMGNVSTATGLHQATMTGPAGTNFNLILYRWNGSSWVQAASSTGTTSTESISYNGTGGLYYLVVSSVSGAGQYNVQWKFPAP